MIRCLILGSGGAVPTPDRSPAAYWLTIDGRSMLMDPGPGALLRLIRSLDGPDSLDDLDTVLLTHLHLDHCADLPALLFALRTPITASEQPLQIIGPLGLAAYLSRLDELFGDWVRPLRREVLILELAPGEGLVPAAGRAGVWSKTGNPDELPAVTAFRAEHSETRFSEVNLGYVFRDEESHTLVFSGDSEPCPELLAAAGGADLLLVECSIPDEFEAPGHMTPSRVGALCRDAAPSRVVLTHLYPACDALDLETLVRELWQGDLVRAADGMLLTVPSLPDPTRKDQA